LKLFSLKKKIRKKTFISRKKFYVAEKEKSQLQVIIQLLNIILRKIISVRGVFTIKPENQNIFF